MTPKQARSVPHVFATAQFAQDRLVDGYRLFEPASLVHAKRMGTMSTLCGASSWSWFKFWGLPFGAVRENRCPRCTRQLAVSLVDDDVRV